MLRTAKPGTYKDLGPVEVSLEDIGEPSRVLICMLTEVELECGHKVTFKHTGIHPPQLDCLECDKKILRSVEPAANDGGFRRTFWCPACEQAHAFNASWQLTGTEDKPTVRPSILVTGGDKGISCHIVITDGMLAYQTDNCTHELAGQTIPMEKF